MFRSYLIRHIAGVHYAVRIFIGASILWLLLHNRQTSNSLWAIISPIVVTDPQNKTAWAAFRAHMFNTVIGCLIVIAIMARIWKQPDPAS